MKMFFCNTAVHDQLSQDVAEWEAEGNKIKVIPEGMKAEQYLLQTENVDALKPEPVELLEDDNQDMSDSQIAADLFQDNNQLHFAEY